MAQSSSLVSIIIPTYNRAPLLKRAVQSVLRQTYTNFEIIVIDDASTDDTEKVVTSFNESRVKYLKNNSNKGPAASRNKGICLAEGEFVAFLDDDDEFLPTKLEKQIKKFAVSPREVGVVYCGILHVYGKLVMYKRMPKGRIKFEASLHPQSMGWPVITGLIKRKCFEKTGLFDESLLDREDWDMLIRMSKYYQFDYVEDILYTRYIHGYQITTNLTRRIKGRETIITKYYEEFLKYPDLLSWQYRLLGSLYCMDGKVAEARKYFVRSVKTWPLNWGSYFHMLLSYLSTSLHKKLIKKIAFKKAGHSLLYY